MVYKESPHGFNVCVRKRMPQVHDSTNPSMQIHVGNAYLCVIQHYFHEIMTEGQCVWWGIEKIREAFQNKTLTQTPFRELIP